MKVSTTIRGAGSVLERLTVYERAVNARLDAMVVTAAKQAQADMVALSRVNKGDQRAALESDDAIHIETKRGRTRASVGFITNAQKKRAFHAFFNEFGTKEYQAGQKRFSGRDKRRGTPKFRKVKRHVPARPAYPWFRPAVAMLRQNVYRLRREAHVGALGDMAKANIMDAFAGAMR